jgi:hypothetical protein
MKTKTRSLLLLAAFLAFVSILCLLGLIVGQMFRPRVAPAPLRLNPASGVILESNSVAELAEAAARRPSHPISDVAEATFRAIGLANRAAKANYGATPYGSSHFDLGHNLATFDGKRWFWRSRVPLGTGDLEAEVEFGADGSDERVNLMMLINDLSMRSRP